MTDADDLLNIRLAGCIMKAGELVVVAAAITRWYDEFMDRLVRSLESVDDETNSRKQWSCSANVVNQDHDTWSESRGKM